LTKYKDWYVYIAVFIYTIYLIFGNLGRIIPTPFFINSISILELALYLLVGLIILFKWKHYYTLVKKNREILFLSLVIFIFSLLGLMYHKGENINLFIYSIRLIIQIISIFVFGDIFNKLFNKDVMKFINFIIITFIIYTVLGWVIYFNFPNAADLWVFLNKYNITFAGDPHVHRLMGGFLDPNFAAGIIILPILLCIYKYFHSEKNQYMYLVIADYFFLCLIYTYSRSGLLGLILSGGIICLINSKYIFQNIKSSIRKAIPIIGSLLIIFVMLNLPAVQQQTRVDNSQSNETNQIEDVQTQDEEETPIDRFLGRFINIGNDPSALHRVSDFRVGIHFLTKSWYTFLFGIGYNYIQHDVNTGLSALDSSILNTIITFGFIGTSSLIFMFIKIGKKTVRNVKAYNKSLLKYISGYMISAIIISNFNNLLYYQYFIMLFGSFLMYFYLNDDTTKENIN